MTSGKLTVRALKSFEFKGLSVLDVVACVSGNDGAAASMFFAKSAPAAQVEAALGGEYISAVSINGAQIVRLHPGDLANDAALCESEFFAGKNVSISTRNGEPVETIIAWLSFHYDYFGMDGAVIFNRAEPGTDDAFLRQFEKALKACDKPVHAVVIEANAPLGVPDMPPEAHPLCVSEAPGHDRMEIPPSDPWLSPLAEMSIYEIARRRFLTEARAVTNLEICDMLYVPVEKLGGKGAREGYASPFDVAANAPGNVIQLEGQHCYPWRVRKGEDPHLADHICVQFDKPKFRVRWCVAPKGLPTSALFKIKKVSDAKVVQRGSFFRCMAIRHPSEQASKIVPKSSLVTSDPLVGMSEKVFDFKAVHPPTVEFEKPKSGDIRTAIVTTMKNEGPFILEWIAYHQAIGVQDFLVFTNDCTDGTDTMFDLLQSKGVLQHRENPFREMDLKPQHAALQAAEKEPQIQNADWAICMDVDEFLNVKVGEGRLKDLYEAVGDANMISCTWRLFGNSDLHEFKDEYTIGMFSRCAYEYAPKPHQAWGFKTLFRNIGIFKKMGVHRPKGLRPQLWDQIRWVNGSGKPLPRSEFRNAWRSTASTYGYDLVSLNHYAVRNADSFLVKRDRGRVNHVDRDQGLAYWFRMNNNATEDTSIMKRIPMMEEKLKLLMADPEIAEQHHKCVAAHAAKIAELKESPAQQAFYEELTSARQERLSRMHNFFGANVFLAGPHVVPEDVLWEDHPEGYLFTVERTETQH